MKRITGISGIFFSAKDAAAVQAWYKRNLEIDVREWGGAALGWTDREGRPVAREIGLNTHLQPHSNTSGAHP